MVIRPCQRTDAHSLSRAYVQTWRGTCLGALPFDYLYHMSEFRQEREFFHELDTTLVDESPT